MDPMCWTDDSPRECTRFFELDWYDGIEVGLFSVRDPQGQESWFIAQRTGTSYGANDDDWNIYECTGIRRGFESFLDPPDPSRERFVEEVFPDEAVEPIRERIDDRNVMLAVIVGRDHRRIERTLHANRLTQRGSAVWSRLFGPSAG